MLAPENSKDLPRRELAFDVSTAAGIAYGVAAVDESVWGWRMELIHYAGGELMTGEGIAHAVLEYAKMLAMNESSDEVEIPIRREDGSLGVAQLLLGPASQLVAETIVSDLEDVTDSDLVTQLGVKAARLANPRPVMNDASTASGADFDLEDAVDSANTEARDSRP
jgi:hypothetical protein